MSNRYEEIHMEGRGDYVMPYTPAIKVTGGSLVFLAGVTAAPVYHSHPHVAAEFDEIPVLQDRAIGEFSIDHRAILGFGIGEDPAAETVFDAGVARRHPPIGNFETENFGLGFAGSPGLARPAATDGHARHALEVVTRRQRARPTALHGQEQ